MVSPTMNKPSAMVNALLSSGASQRSSNAASP
jgi:hypothetical protein